MSVELIWGVMMKGSRSGSISMTSRIMGMKKIMLKGMSNISFEANLVIYKNRTSIPPRKIMKRI